MRDGGRALGGGGEDNGGTGGRARSALACIFFFVTVLYIFRLCFFPVFPLAYFFWSEEGGGATMTAGYRGVSWRSASRSRTRLRKKACKKTLLLQWPFGLRVRITHTSCADTEPSGCFAFSHNVPVPAPVPYPQPERAQAFRVPYLHLYPYLHQRGM